MVLEVARETARLKQSARRVVASPTSSPRVVSWLVSLAALAAAVVGVGFSSNVSHSIFIPLIVAAGFLLSGRHLIRVVATVLTCYTVVAVSTWNERSSHWTTFVVILAVVALVAVVTRRRLTMGVPLSVASGLLKDLRERLDTQALTPEMPGSIRMEQCVLPARGDAFSGDFVVSARRGGQLSLALTDVSGSGPAAGMRALLLSGALSGLLGETRPEDFLPAANRYLIRQGWRDGFASAIHVSLDVEAGEFCIGTAGHPSAAHYHAGTRRWEMIWGASGLLLGLFEQGPEDYTRTSGLLEPGDVLLLYTDGIVEGPDGDLVAGTHQMLAMAQSAIGVGPEGSARRICEASAKAGGDDDRSVVVIWRSVPESIEGENAALDVSLG